MAPLQLKYRLDETYRLRSFYLLKKRGLSEEQTRYFIYFHYYRSHKAGNQFQSLLILQPGLERLLLKCSR